MCSALTIGCSKQRPQQLETKPWAWVYSPAPFAAAPGIPGPPRRVGRAGEAPWPPNATMLHWTPC